MRYKYSLIPLRGTRLLLVVLFSIFVVGCSSTGATNSKETATANSTMPVSNGGDAAASTGSLSGGWMYAFSNAVEFLQLTVNDSQISGQEQDAYEVSFTSALQQESSGVSGVFNGTEVTISLTMWGFPMHTYAGTYENNTLTLTEPDQGGTLQSVAYQPASVDDYNNAVQQLQQNVYNESATATAVAYQEQVAAATASAISNEQQNLASNVSGIGGVINQLQNDTDFSNTLAEYNKDIQHMQADYQTAQNDAANGGCSTGQVTVDVGTVTVDDGKITVDDGAMSSQVYGAQGDLSNLQSWVNTIQQQWNDLGSTPFPGVSANDVSSAIQNGNTAINQATSAMKSAQDQVSSFDSQANQILSQAQAICS